MWAVRVGVLVLKKVLGRYLGISAQRGLVSSLALEMNEVERE